MGLVDSHAVREQITSKGRCALESTQEWKEGLNKKKER
jgi:hypothetical protein